jgi:hypothetical protein
MTAATGTCCWAGPLSSRERAALARKLARASKQFWDAADPASIRMLPPRSSRLAGGPGGPGGPGSWAAPHRLGSVREGPHPVHPRPPMAAFPAWGSMQEHLGARRGRAPGLPAVMAP